MEKNIYVVFSCTHYRVGKMIRALTRGQYNHVSIALDRDLSRMYSFARRYYSTPLLGGFVKESLSRYYFNGKASNCTICQIPVSATQYTTLEKQLEKMYAHKEQYLYNYLSVLTVPFRRRVPVRNALLCVEFVADILSRLDTPVASGKFYTVRTLSTLLEAFAIYTGTMPMSTEYDRDYFAPKPVTHPLITSLRNIFALFPRLHKSHEKPHSNEQYH